MLFQITSVGMTAVNNAQVGGPKITVTSYKLGTGVAYTPNVSDTALHGAELYSGVINDYRVESFDLVAWVLRADSTVGDFSFGEIGLYLNTGELFALAALPTVQQKVKSTVIQVGNVIEIVAKLNFTNIAPTITFPIVQLINARLLEISSVDILTIPLISNTNAYIVTSGDDAGHPILAIRQDDDFWGFDTHKIPVVAGGAVTSATIVDITSPDLGNVIDVQAGKYILQILDGTNKGLCRHITSKVGSTISWLTSTGVACSPGTTFRVFRSDYSILAQAQAFSIDSSSVLDESLINAIVFGSR